MKLSFLRFLRPLFRPLPAVFIVSTAALALGECSWSRYDVADESKFSISKSSRVTSDEYKVIINASSCRRSLKVCVNFHFCCCWGTVCLGSSFPLEYLRSCVLLLLLLFLFKYHFCCCCCCCCTHSCKSMR